MLNPRPIPITKVALDESDIAEIVGRRPPRLRFPIAALYPVALGAEWYARLTGKEPFATRDGLRMARHYMFFNDAKARRELGYTSRPYREAIAQPGAADSRYSTAAYRASVGQGIDVAVANAGVCILKPWDEVTPQIWEDTSSVGLTGVWNTMTVAAPDRPGLLSRAAGVLALHSLQVHAAVLVEHDGVLRGRTPDQATRSEILDLVDESKGTRERQLAREVLGRDARLEALRPDQRVRKVDRDVQLQRVSGKGLVDRMAILQTYRSG